MKVVFDPARHCGATGKQGGGPCRHTKGFRTDHQGAGSCWLHGGRSPNGKQHAQHEAAVAAVAALGLPRGNGDPFALLASAVQHAHGYLEATAAVVQEAAQAAASPVDGKTPTFGLEAAAGLYAPAIRNAARIGKAAVDADVADRLAALDERASGLLMQFVGELLERVVPKGKRLEVEAWASMRLGELAAEYERPGAVH
jgi:hypothetical protein